MPKTTRQYRVVVASPGDCKVEREAVVDAISRWNDVVGTHRALELRPQMWEHDTYPEQGGRPQELINRQIVQDADLLIGLFWKRLGQPTGTAASGTAEEIEQFVASGRPALIYFSRRPVDLEDIDLDQIGALRAYRATLQSQGLVSEFTSAVDLRDRVQKDLSALMERIAPLDSRLVSPRLSAEALAAVKKDVERLAQARQQMYALKSDAEEDYDEVLDTSQAPGFYNEIAARYDARQSDDLIDVHYGAIAFVRRAIQAVERPMVLDLGGGTGHEIAAHFAPRSEVRWWYVDASIAMLRRFDRHMTRARMQTSLVLGDAFKQLDAFAGDRMAYDAVVVSWLLSSLPRDLPFESLRRILAPTGRLIIADAALESLKVHPLYGVALDDRRIALRLRPVDPDGLRLAAGLAGLEWAEEPAIIAKKDGSPYGFVHVYRHRST